MNEELIKNFIINNQNMKAKDIAKYLNITIYQVYNRRKRYGITNHLNQEFILNDIQKQILYGGKLGDGNFKLNGSNHYYRECHSIKEKEYLLWKYEKLYDFTTKKIFHISKRKESQSDQIGFQTKNSSSFSKIANMTIEEIISNLNELGFLIWLLDDGWISGNHICISPGTLTYEQINLIINKIKEITGIEIHIIGIKRIDLSIPSQYNKKIKELIDKYFDKEIDVIIKKIKPLRL